MKSIGVPCRNVTPKGRRNIQLLRRACHKTTTDDDDGARGKCAAKTRPGGSFLPPALLSRRWPACFFFVLGFFSQTPFVCIRDEQRTLCRNRRTRKRSVRRWKKKPAETVKKKKINADGRTRRLGRCRTLSDRQRATRRAQLKIHRATVAWADIFLMHIKPRAYTE